MQLYSLQVKTPYVTYTIWISYIFCAQIVAFSHSLNFLVASQLLDHCSWNTLPRHLRWRLHQLQVSRTSNMDTCVGYTIVWSGIYTSVTDDLTAGVGVSYDSFNSL